MQKIRFFPNNFLTLVSRIEPKNIQAPSMFERRCLLKIEGRLNLNQNSKKVAYCRKNSKGGMIGSRVKR